MTAAVIVQLAQEGRLDLDDPVSKYVSGVPDGDQIIIADLLKMRSGLYNYTDAPEISASAQTLRPFNPILPGKLTRANRALILATKWSLRRRTRDQSTTR
jgi:CubicO group peptidase (beta-lactamase class C family)